MRDESSARTSAAERLRLGGFVLDLNARELLGSDGQHAQLRRQAMEVLLTLGARAGHVVSKDELMRIVWPGVVVGEGSLSQAISDIRRVLGDKEHLLVRNIARRGYMLVPDAADAVNAAGEADTAEAPLRIQPRFPAPHGRLTILYLLTILSLFGGWVVWGSLDGRQQALEPSERVRAPLAEDIAAISMVVLPLAVDGDDDVEWFADALLSDLILEVGRLGQSEVIARDTAQTYRGIAIDPRDVARELRVRYVVQGRLRADGDRIQLGLTLIDGDTGTQRWSEKFVVERGRLDSALDEFVLQLARFLQVEVARSAGARLDKMSPAAVSADDLSMRSRAAYFRGFNRHNLLEALALAEQSVAMDPDSRAWGSVAIMNLLGAVNGWLPDREAAFDRVEVANLHLDRLDPESFPAMQAKAFIAGIRKDGPAMLRLSKAWAERYRHPVALGAYGYALMVNGRHEEAIAPLEMALRLSPRDVFRGEWQYRLALAHFLGGRYEQARDWGQAANASNPSLPWPPVHAAALVRLGKADEARQILEDTLARHPGYDAGRIHQRLDHVHPDFIVGRDGLIASLRKIGLP